MANYKENFKNTEATRFVLDEYTCGFAQCVDNNWNYAIYAQNPDICIYQNTNTTPDMCREKSRPARRFWRHATTHGATS